MRLYVILTKPKTFSEDFTVFLIVKHEGELKLGDLSLVISKATDLSTFFITEIDTYTE